MKMLREFEQFLVEQSFLPLETARWNSFMINHLPSAGEAEKTQAKEHIRFHVKMLGGIYVYKNSAGEVLYVGKAKSLFNRLYSHYIESFQEVPGDTKDKRWHRFFSSHQGELHVIWCAVEEEITRQIIEKMLSYSLEPTFEKFSTTPKMEPKVTTSFKEKREGVVKNYRFFNSRNDLIDRIQQIIGDNFMPTFNATGVTFFKGKKRILKLVEASNHYLVEFNVPVSRSEGVQYLTESEARAKKMGTCQWIYKGNNLDDVLRLTNEAITNWSN